MSGNCNDRINKHLQGRLQTLKLLFAVIDGKDLKAITSDPTDLKEYDGMRQEGAEAELEALALGTNATMLITIQLSTGGPGDQFELELTQDRHGKYTEISDITYRFLDWFDNASKRLRDDDFALVERYARSILPELE